MHGGGVVAYQADHDKLAPAWIIKLIRHYWLHLKPDSPEEQVPGKVVNAQIALCLIMQK